VAASFTEQAAMSGGATSSSTTRGAPRQPGRHERVEEVDEVVVDGPTASGRGGSAAVEELGSGQRSSAAGGGARWR